jgi:hypothetical protein
MAAVMAAVMAAGVALLTAPRPGLRRTVGHGGHPQPPEFAPPPDPRGRRTGLRGARHDCLVRPGAAR